MTITNPNAFTSDTANWMHSTFMVKLGNDHVTYKEVLEDLLKDETYGSVGNPSLSSDMSTIVSSIGSGDSSYLPSFYAYRNCRDTTLGGNDAINCYYQFNEHDDVPHPFTYADSAGVSREGRVYKEVYQDNQQIMWLGFGVPVFNSLGNFYKSLVNKDLATLMNKGASASSMEHIGYMVGRAAITFVTLPVIPILFLNNVLSTIIKTPVTKYYDFKSEMPLYYRLVQVMLVHLAVNMSIMDGSNNGEVIAPSDNGYTTNTNSQSGQTAGDVSSGTASDANQGLPKIFSDFKLDIFQIMLKRYYYEKGDASIWKYSSDDALAYQAQESQQTDVALDNADIIPEEADGYASTFKDSMFNAFHEVAGAFGGTLYDAQLFVGFKIERGVDTSESLSHQIGPSEIKNTLNSGLQANRQKMFSAENGNFAGFGAVGDAVGSFIKGVAGLATGIGDIAGLSGIAAYMTGAGNVDIPDVWQDSSFNKNYSFTLQLRTPYGDPVSILQSLYVPLCMILAGSLPRAIGANAYTSPFLCRAYCKGFFATPMAIIDSVTVTRGGDVHGWAQTRLPTAIDVSFTLKDLSPLMFIALGDGQGIWDQLFGANSSFNEYLMTLSAMGLRERILPFRNLKRKAHILASSVLETKLNPFYWGMEAASAPPLRYLMAITPTTALSAN